MAVVDRLKVTENDEAQPNTTVKYLEAVANTDYELKCEISKGGFDFGEADYLSFKFYIDGKYVSSHHAQKLRYRARPGAAFTSKGSRAVVDGQWRGFSYRWGELITTEEHSHLTLTEIKQRYAELGTIRVEVWRKEGTETRAARPKYLPPAEQIIPEKALKGNATDLITHRGVPRELKNRPKRTISKKLDRTPVATFTFKYRSKNALQVLGIIPRSPSLVPQEARDPASLTHEEALELIRRQQEQLDAANARIKQENNEANVHQFTPLKRKVLDGSLNLVAGRRKRARQEVETIDLTDD